MLVLVVGPSGAGKDTLLDAARRALAGNPRFRFVRRVITRFTSAGEAHEPVTEAEFVARRFALTWQAYGVRYGIPADIEPDIAAGRIVVANVSRGVIAEAARRFPARVIEITAPAPVLAMRLAARGRETKAEIIRRLDRRVDPPPGVPIIPIVNDGSLHTAIDAFIAALADFSASDPLA